MNALLFGISPAQASVAEPDKINYPVVSHKIVQHVNQSHSPSRNPVALPGNEEKKEQGLPSSDAAKAKFRKFQALFKNVQMKPRLRFPQTPIRNADEEHGEEPGDKIGGR